jgi:glycosyltransferase involved in cell wall biosynthesis
MAAGIPVVSFDCPFGPAEMIEHDVDGILVRREDVNALADALRRVMKDPLLRARLGTSAAESAKRFTPAAVADEWELIVSEAALAGASQA